VQVVTIGAKPIWEPPLATTALAKLLLNRGDEAESSQVVDAPAFSLTKVLASGAVVITPIAAAVVTTLKDGKISTQQYVLLGLGVLAFLAITASADVLARAIATAAEKKAEAATASTAGLLRFSPPLPGRRILDSATEPDPAIEILAAVNAGKPFFLVKEGDEISWLPAAKVHQGS
jgi:hypothetical protein